MKIYDISQELFSSAVWPGDPAPVRDVIASIDQGSLCNVTAFSMCAHNGTHIDAPCHFIRNADSVDNIPLEKLVGYCYVACHEGLLLEEDALRILEKARRMGNDCHMRILLKGRCTVTDESAKIFSDNSIFLVGNESQTVGPEQAPMSVHKILLGKNVALLEGIRLQSVTEGSYILCAAPINLGGSDGAPCRAVLIQI